MAIWKTWWRCPLCGKYLNQGKTSYTPGRYPLAVRQFLGGKDSRGRPICESPEPLLDEEATALDGELVKALKSSVVVLSRRFGIWPQQSAPKRGKPDEDEPKQASRVKQKKTQKLKTHSEPRRNHSVSLADIALTTAMETTIRVETAPLISGRASVGQIFTGPPLELLEEKTKNKE